MSVFYHISFQKSIIVIIPILFFVTVQPLHLLVFIFMKTRSLVVPQIRHSGLPHCLRLSTCHNLLSDIRLACAKVFLLIFSHLQNLPPVTLYRCMATQKTAGSCAFSHDPAVFSSSMIQFLNVLVCK